MSYATKVYREQGGDNLVILDGGGLKTEPNGTVGHAAITASPGRILLKKAIFTLKDLSVAIADNTANGGAGSQLLWTVPAGKYAQVLTSSVNLSIARVGTNLSATAAIVAALGVTAAGADASLSSLEANILASTAGTLAAGVGTVANAAAINLLIGDVIDDVYLNFACPDAGISGADALLVNGTIALTWLEMTFGS